MSTSLYQQCSDLLDRLACVPGFQELFLSAPSSSSSSQPTHKPDPVTRVWDCLRNGASLCYLVNYLCPNTITNVHPPHLTADNSNLAKSNIYYFLLACKNTLQIDESYLFSISDLFRDDTNGFIKVLLTVEQVMQMVEMDERVASARTRQRTSTVSARSHSRFSMESARSNSDKVIVELLETERKYVADLEVLQNYMKLVSQSQLLPEQTVRLIFGNLDHLVDFQRRFLVGLEDACSVEESAAEKISSLFMMNEAAFAVYGPYCANHRQASDMIVNVAQDLAKIKDGLEPNYELPSYLIKPIQRVCKYPLLFRELSKFLAADERAADKRAVENAYESVNRVTSMVNEIRRKDENIAMVRILEKRVEDWKGFNIHNFGELLLDINLMMERLEVEREMHIFLFERILICCKEVKKEKKRSLSLHRSRTSSLNSEKSYQLKGGVAISQMEGLVSSNRNNTHELKVFYKDSESGEMESFILKYLNEEPMKAWHSALERLISNFRRKSSMSNASRRSANTHASSSRRSLPTSADGKKSASTSRQNSQAAEHGRYNYPHYSANADKTPMLREQQQQQPAVSTDGEVWTLEKALLELDAFKEESHSDTEDSSSIIITPANPRHHASQSSSSSTPTVTPPVRGSSSASSSSVDSLKVKVHFMDDIFVLMTSVRVQFQELFRQIMQRVNEIDGHVADANSSLKVRYVDEDGDYITIRSDGDLSLAIKLASTGAGRALTLFVSRIEK